MPTVQGFRCLFVSSKILAELTPRRVSNSSKRVKVHSSEQGLLSYLPSMHPVEVRGVPLPSQIFSLWWQVGHFITRLIHSILADRPHRARLYVDDLLAALLHTCAHESLLVLVLLICLGAPISW